MWRNVLKDQNEAGGVEDSHHQHHPWLPHLGVESNNERTSPSTGEATNETESNQQNKQKRILLTNNQWIRGSQHDPVGSCSFYPQFTGEKPKKKHIYKRFNGSSPLAFMIKTKIQEILGHGEFAHIFPSPKKPQHRGVFSQGATVARSKQHILGELLRSWPSWRHMARRQKISRRVLDRNFRHRGTWPIGPGDWCAGPAPAARRSSLLQRCPGSGQDQQWYAKYAHTCIIQIYVEI